MAILEITRKKGPPFHVHHVYAYYEPLSNTKEGEVNAKLDVGPNIQLCGMYSKNISQGWAMHMNWVSKYMQNQLKSYFAKQGKQALLFVEKHHAIIQH